MEQKWVSELHVHTHRSHDKSNGITITGFDQKQTVHWVSLPDEASLKKKNGILVAWKKQRVDE